MSARHPLDTVRTNPDTGTNHAGRKPIQEGHRVSQNGEKESFHESLPHIILSVFATITTVATRAAEKLDPDVFQIDESTYSSITVLDARKVIVPLGYEVNGPAIEEHLRIITAATGCAFGPDLFSAKKIARTQRDTR